MSDKTADEILSETDELSPQEFYDKYGYTQSHAKMSIYTTCYGTKQERKP